jgi:excisionase family DNA binding protein
MPNSISSRGVGVCADKGTTASRESSTPEPWLSLKEAAQYTGFDVRTIRRRALAGLIPHGKLGRNLRFKPSEIDDVLRKGGA